MGCLLLRRHPYCLKGSGLMAYEGYLVKVGNYEIPFKYMRAESYSVSRSVQDLDSYRDAHGELHRTALQHVPNRIEFETPAMLTSVSFTDLMSNIQKNFINEIERRASVTMYVPETDSYDVQDMYMPDITPKIYHADREKIQYMAVRLAFIGY